LRKKRYFCKSVPDTHFLHQNGINSSEKSQIQDMEHRKSGAGRRHSDKPFGKRTERKPSERSNDRKPFKRSFDPKKTGANDRRSNESAYERRKTESGDRKPFVKRTDSDTFEKSDRKPFVKRGDSDRFGKKPFERRGDSDRFGKKPFERRGDSDRFEKKPFERRGDSERFDKSDRKPFVKRTESDRFEKKPLIKRTDSGDFEKSEGKPYSRKNEQEKFDRPERKSLIKRTDSDKDSKPVVKRTNSEHPDYREKNRVIRPRKNSGGEKRSSGKQEGLVRLNKFIADAGICSRREADTFISTGLVTVNGILVTELGSKVSKTDVVKFNGRTLRSEKLVYILMNKPKDTITTVSDTHERDTVLDLLGNDVHEKVYPVGRLDRNTTGVLLITNDGELTKRLTHPSYKKKKIYHVFLDKNVTYEHLQKLTEGIQLDDEFVKFDVANYALPDDKTEVGVEIHSGQNRVVRRMFESLGYKVRKLDRVYFAGLTKKNVPRGTWRYLTEQEISVLKMGSYE